MGKSINGSVFHNATRNCWQFAYYFMDAVTGEKKRRVETCQDQEDAERRKEQYTNIVAGMNMVARPVAESKVLRQQSPLVQKHLVSNYLDMLLEDYFKVGISPETYSLYQNHCMHIKKGFAGRYLEDINRSDVQAFLNRFETVKGKPSWSTQNHVRIMLSRMFKYALDDDIIVKNPMAVGIRIEQPEQTDSLKFKLSLDV